MANFEIHVDTYSICLHIPFQQHVFPEAEVEPPLDAFATEPSSQTSELSDPSIDTDSSTESGSISPQTSDLEEWENISDEEEDVTISYGDTSVPKGVLNLYLQRFIRDQKK